MCRVDGEDALCEMEAVLLEDGVPDAMRRVTPIARESLRITQQVHVLHVLGRVIYTRASTFHLLLVLSKITN